MSWTILTNLKPNREIILMYMVANELLVDDVCEIFEMFGSNTVPAVR